MTREQTNPIRRQPTAIVSDDPPSPDSGDIKIGRRGLTIKWKTCLGILALIGGGTLAGGGWYTIATNGQVDAKIETHANVSEKQVGEIARKLDADHQTLGEHTTAIKLIGTKVTDGFAVLYGQVARDEARRLTAQIRDREDRERQYDRLVDANLRRLAQGRAPCAVVMCDP